MRNIWASNRMCRDKEFRFGGKSMAIRRISRPWSIFEPDTKYFQPSTKPFMLNFRVEDLDGLLERLRGEGVWIDPNREDYDYGRFAWVMDPEGNRITLWEPPRRS
jgi:catechol 2,3-dioxygenase-like lactoylglutathione lyase family enzyme